MTNITQQENESNEQYVLRLMEAMVNKMGEEYVYDAEDGCHYVREGQPSCIVGHVLAEAGVPLDMIQQHEGRSALVMVPDLTSWGDKHAPIILALDEAQHAQDHGNTWGDVLEVFRRNLGLE